MSTVQRHPDHPEAQPKPGETVVWRWDGTDEALPEIPHAGSCHCASHSHSHNLSIHVLCQRVLLHIEMLGVFD